MRSVKKRFNLRRSINFVKILLTVAYLIFLPTYIIVGLQPANATNPKHHKILQIPDISLSAPVEELLVENNTLETPNFNVGAYSEAHNKTLLIGHSTTIFKNLSRLDQSAQVVYDNEPYRITKITTTPKSLISMPEILAPAPRQTLVLMTCAGKSLGSQDYTHRLLITATKI